jgi:hypothetical protein
VSANNGYVYAVQSVDKDLIKIGGSMSGGTEGESVSSSKCESCGFDFDRVAMLPYSYVIVLHHNWKAMVAHHQKALTQGLELAVNVEKLYQLGFKHGEERARFWHRALDVEDKQVITNVRSEIQGYVS